MGANPARVFGLRVLALLFGLVTALYCFVWIYYTVAAAPSAYLGVDWDYQWKARGFLVHAVRPESPAERVGLRPGDLVESIGGLPLDGPNPAYDFVVRGHPGDHVAITVRRKGESRPIDLDVTIQARPEGHYSPLQAALWPLHLYPLPFLLVGIGVLSLRVDDRSAWLLAMTFAGLSAGPTVTFEAVIHPSLRGFMLACATLAEGLAPASLYGLLATFPSASPLDRRVPWLKTAFFVVAALVYVPVAASIFSSGSPFPFIREADRLGGLAWLEAAARTFAYGALLLALVSVVLNSRLGESAETRRKSRFLLWSFALALLPWLTLVTVALIRGDNPFLYPAWIWGLCAFLLMMLPLMVAYTIVRHRVFEFPIFLRLSARYLLVQRGFLLLSFAVSIAVTMGFALAIGRLLPRSGDAALPAAIGAGALFGLVLVRTGGAVARRVSRRIDRAFFRNLYDASQLLEDLVQRTSLVTSRTELVQLLQEHLAGALHPREVAIYLREASGALSLQSQPRPGCPVALTDDDPLVAELARAGRPLEPGAAAFGRSPLAALQADCLVPMLSRRRALSGVIALGPRLSDDPYSREDKALLASIAGQAATALENLVLAEQMAERLEAERRATQELRIAADVQRRLLPARAVTLPTLECAGHCTQARAVGGDYYDFLDLWDGQLGVVLADVSGKGLYAALLMASLQASLRSLSAGWGSRELPQLLQRLNRSFGDSTGRSHYATLFFGLHDPAARTWSYVDCGHCPPIVMRADGTAERLDVTGVAVGLFEEWSGTAGQVSLAPGDVLAVFSDGVTEAVDAAGDEFGDARLVEALRAQRQRPLTEAVEAIIDEVRRFGGRDQFDDMTLVLARGRG